MHSLIRGLLGITILCFLLGCTGIRSNSIPSPDGKLTLVTSINGSKDNPVTYLCIKFQIIDTMGKVLYEEQTGASDRMRWSMYWKDAQHVILDSSDIGTMIWEQQADGSWQKSR